MDCPDSDDVESCHPDSSDFEDESDDESRDKNRAVTVENLAEDRISLSLKIKATLSKKYGKNGTEHVTSSKEVSTILKASDVPEEGIDKAGGSSEQNKGTDKNSKIKATPLCAPEDLSTDKEGDVTSKTLMDVEVNGDANDNPIQDEQLSIKPVPQIIDQDSSGFAPPNCNIAELINKIVSTAYKCTECDIDLSNYKEWKNHLKMHNIDVSNLTEEERKSLGECIPEFNCVICGWKGKRKGGLQVHLRSHENDVTCDVCGIMFKKVKELKIHMRYHDFTEHQCHICKKSFPDNNSLVRHIATHTTEKLKRDRHELLCEICSRMFHAPNLLAIHLKTHKKISGFRCENCDITFKKRSLYANHLKNIHNDIKDSFVCRVCKIQLDTKDDLNEHMKEHIGEQSFRLKNENALKFRKTIFKCTQCDKVFKRKSQFTVHMMIHTGEKPYICDVCGIGFRVSGSLKKHQFVHSGSKPLKCRHCGKCFAYNSSLFRHMLLHNDEKPYVCKTCGKGFRASSYLKSHQRVHGFDGDNDTGKTSCSICHKQYRFIDNHMKRHFKNQPFKPKSFSRDLRASTSSIPKIRSLPPPEATSVASNCNKPELIKTSQIINSNEPISFPVNNSSTFIKDLGVASKSTFGESSHDMTTEFSRELAAVSKNINKSSSQDISDDDSGLLIGFDDDDDDDNSVTSHGFVSLTGKSDDSTNSLHSDLHTPEPHSEQDENPEDTNTNHTPDTKNDFDKTQEEADQGKKIHTKLCQDICEDSEMLENTLKSTIKKIDMGIEAEISEKPVEGCGRKLRSLTRTKLKLDENVNEQIKNKTHENTEVPSIEETDFDEGEDDHTEDDSMLQNVISHLDNLIEEISNDESKKGDTANYEVTKPKKRGKNQLITCDVCGDGFKTTLSYEAHLQIHSTSDILPKDVIWDFFESKNGIYFCKKCDKKCKTKGTAFVHSKFHLGIAPFTCEICDETFQLAVSLKKHYLCHGTYKRFKCKYCDRGFNLSSRLKRHLLTHENARNYMCDTCGGKFNTPGYLREHMKIHGSSGEERNRKQRNRYKAREKRQCPVCGKVVKELETHLKNHKKERNYQCSYCDKAFVSSKTLHKHSKVHTGIKKFICQYASCGKAFLHNSDLNRHEMIHEKRKTFNSLKCDYCVAVYSNETDLKKHLKLHKSSKWSCDICNRVFEKQNKLISHASVHTREKPHKCNLCTAAFTQKGTLQRHMRERHSPKIIL